jgi:hypothetical protein
MAGRRVHCHHQAFIIVSMVTYREDEFANGRIPRDDELITHTWYVEGGTVLG